MWHGPREAGWFWDIGRSTELRHDSDLCPDHHAAAASNTGSSISCWPLLSLRSYWATLTLNIPDFTRWARSQRAQVVGQAIGLPLFQAAFCFAGLAVTSGEGAGLEAQRLPVRYVRLGGVCVGLGGGGGGGPRVEETSRPAAFTSAGIRGTWASGPAVTRHPASPEARSTTTLYVSLSHHDTRPPPRSHPDPHPSPSGPTPPSHTVQPRWCCLARPSATPSPSCRACRACGASPPPWWGWCWPR